MSETLTRDRFRLLEAVKSGEGGFDLEAFHAMDRRDNTHVEQELMHGAGSKAFVYDFKIQGKMVVGVSVIGARHLAATYGGIKHQLIGSMQKTGSLFTFTSYPQPGIPMDMKCAVLPELSQEPDFYAAVVEVTDVKQGNTIQVERRELRFEKRQDGTLYERPMYATIAQSKAYRNAVLALVPQDVLLNFKVKMLSIGNSEGVTEDAIADKRAAILRFAAGQKIPVDRRAIEALTFDQIAGLSDAAKADKVDGFRAAAEALGILARLGITAEQMPQPRTATQRPASAPAPQQQQAPAPEQERQQAPATEAAAPQFEAVLYAADGQAVGDGVIYADPAEYARDLEVLHRATFPADRQALLEHNADGIEDASTAAVAAAATILAALDGNERPEAPAVVAVEVPVVRNRPSWSGWLEALKAAQADLEPETAPAWIEAQRPAVESALPSAKLQAVRLLHATAKRLSLPLPAWFATVVVAEEPPTPVTTAEKIAEIEQAGDDIGIASEVVITPPAEAKRDRDDIWADDFLGAINSETTDAAVVGLCRYQSTVTVMERLKREKPDLYRRVFDGIDAKRAALKAHKENGNEPNTAGK